MTRVLIVMQCDSLSKLRCLTPVIGDPTSGDYLNVKIIRQKNKNDPSKIRYRLHVMGYSKVCYKFNFPVDCQQLPIIENQDGKVQSMLDHFDPQGTTFLIHSQPLSQHNRWESFEILPDQKIYKKLIIFSISLFPIHVRTSLLKIFWQNIFLEKTFHFLSLHNCSFNPIALPICYSAIRIRKQVSPNQDSQNQQANQNRLLAFLENREKLSQKKWNSMKWILILKYPPS